MVSVRIYLEGGGNDPSLKSKLRQGFSQFWKKAGLQGKMPKTIACGSRNEAFKDFCAAVITNRTDVSILLIDSEQAFDHAQEKWAFLLQQNQWQKPEQASQNQLHFMVQSMEAWLLADRATLQKFYGSAFESKALPAGQTAIDSLSPQQLEASLKNASKDTSKGSYNKSKHSFELIGLIDPEKVMQNCPSAKDLIDHIRTIS